MRSWVFYTKILTVILLGLSINLPTLITKQYLEQQRKTIRLEVKAKINAGLKDSELIRLAFEKAAFESQVIWYKADEFEYNNIMYDIVRPIPSLDSIIYLCWQDHDESAIKQKLNELSKSEWSQHRNKDKNKDRQQEFYKNLFCHDRDMVEYTPHLMPGLSNEKISYDKHFIKRFYTPTFGPPPEG